MGRTGWAAVRAGGRCQPRGTQQGPRAESHRNHLMRGRGGREAAAGKPSGGHVHKPHRKTRGTGEPLGAGRPPDPPVPSASLPSGSSVSEGPPRLSVLPAPSAPRRGPMGAPLPPGPHQPLHLVCQPAALPGGKRAQEAGSGQGGRRTRGPCWGSQRPGQPSLGPGPGLGQGSEGRAGAR